VSSLLSSAWNQSNERRARTSSLPVDRDLIALALVAALAFALRITQLHQSLAGDEVFSYQDVVGRSFGAVLSTVHAGGENSPPLFFLLAWATAKLGDASVWLRLPSVLAGTATVVVVYAIARVSVGRAAGLIAAAIMAVAPFAVFYGIEARPYATMVFLVALSTLALLHALRTRHPAWWTVYTLATAAAAYTHYTAIFLLAAQGAYSLWAARDRLTQPLLANAAVVLLYLPWLPNLRGKALAVIGALYPLTVHRVLGDLLRPFPGHPSAPLSAIPTAVGMIVFALCVLAGAVATAMRARGRSPTVRWPPRGLVLLIVLALATPVGLLAYSLLVTDLWLPRGLSASIPAGALVIGALLTGLPRRWLVVATAAVLAVLLLGTLRSFEPAYARGPFRSIAAQLDRTAPRRDPVALISLVGYLAVQEQFRAPHTIVNTLGALWRHTPVGANAYLVLDDQISRLGRLGTPRHPGFELVSRRHYTGASATVVLVYRRVSAA
jgi:hypothetical protein